MTVTPELTPAPFSEAGHPRYMVTNEFAYELTVVMQDTQYFKSGSFRVDTGAWIRGELYLDPREFTEALSRYAEYCRKAR